jgi:SAM-dependent methyltransferase
MAPSAAPPPSIASAVADRYSAIGAEPTGEQSIPVGREWATRLGYPDKLLGTIPVPALAAFTGIGAPILAADLQRGEIVLDLGCGSGLDTILAARQVSEKGHVHSVDFAPAMVERAAAAAATAGCHNVTTHQCSAASLPLNRESIDVALVNGLFNLTPEKEAVVREVRRVMRPSGRITGSEIVITDGKPAPRPDLESWFR